MPDWYESMSSKDWLQLWRSARVGGNAPLAKSLLHVAFDHADTCVADVLDAVLFHADGQRFYQHKQRCDRCAAHLAGSAGAMLCPRGEVFFKAQHTIVYGLLRKPDGQSTYTFRALGWLLETDPEAGNKLINFLWYNHSWLTVNKQEMVIARAFLAHIDVQWLKLHLLVFTGYNNDFIRTLCLYGEADRLNRDDQSPDPKLIETLHAIAIGEHASVRRAYADPQTSYFQREAARVTILLDARLNP